MVHILKAAAFGAAAIALAACGGGHSSKVEELIETCWAPGIKRQTGVADIKISEIKVTESELSEADKQNGFTWAATVQVKFTYQERAGGPWTDSMRMPGAAVRQGVLRLERADGLDCKTEV